MRVRVFSRGKASARDSSRSGFPPPLGRSAFGGFFRLALLMVVVSFATFALVEASPVDPVQANVGQQALLSLSDAKRAQLAAYWGSDAPLIERYLTWVQGALHGDWGVSLRFGEPVVRVVGERLAGSCLLLLSSWMISGAVGMLLGIVAAVRRGTLVDRGIRGACIVLSSTPAFWVGIVFLMLFSVWLGWFPLGLSVPIGAGSSDISIADRLAHLVLPVLTLSVVSAPGVVLQAREKAVDVLASDYARFSLARGEAGAGFVARHVLRNAAVPVVTLQLSSIGELIGASVLVEQVFSYPGLGQAAVVAGVGGDAPLLVGIALASSALVFAGNASADALRRLIDPRVREGREYGEF